ncbi:RHS repeat domain-containing protein [Treponema denticola]|uniref:RHS repeat domain-containing protein n=1 Tax=Treponema denticola TaxID=158 RepID=UPI003D07D4F9
MKTNLYFYSQLNYLPRTAIEAEILFAVCLSKKKALTGGKFLAREDKYSKKIGVKSAVLTLVYFYIIMIVHKCQQSAKRKLLLNKNNLSDVFQLTVGSGKTMAFENRRGKYKEIGKKVPQAYRVYVEHLFLRSDAGDARIFSKEGNMTNKLSSTNIPGSQGNSYPKAELDYNLDYEYDPAYAHRLIHAGTRYYRYDANGNITAEKDGPFTDEEEFVFTYSYDPETDVYGTDYGFGLDAPKETEQANPQDLFAYRRNYTWNERNLLTKSSDRNYTVHYRYGEDGQRALKYTDEGRSETLYFNNFFTIHIPTQDQNNPQGLRVHKHIFVGNSRLVTAMTHTDNSGDNEEQKAKRYYYHSDHLGSAQFVTDWKGRQYEHIEYTPYGELWIEEVAAGLDKLPFRFTGKELDEETGLYYYGARYLDPKYSRWLSGDPALGDYIPKAPVDDEAKKHNENLSGMGGVYNTVNLHVYHYAGNNPVKYTDPDGRLLINNVSENSASAREYERNHNLRYIAFLIKTLDAKGNAQIPIGNIDIILEKGLNKSLTLANAVKNNPNYVVDVKAIASETKNGNYQIDIDVLVFHYGADGKLVCDVNNSGTIAFADSSELGVFGPNSSIDQKLVNQKANEVINTVLHISNANLVGDK